MREQADSPGAGVQPGDHHRAEEPGGRVQRQSQGVVGSQIRQHVRDQQAGRGDADEDG